MPLQFAGYFPKRIAARDAWLKAPLVREIWSVSECMSKGPPDWISRWVHNDFWLFDTCALAESVIPAGERAAHTILGYRVWDRMFDEGTEVAVPVDLPQLIGPDPGFATVGFDAVARSGTSFEHSPLSCNGLAAEVPTNEACLFRSFDEAVAGAKAFSVGNCEPGPYYVVEVLSERSPWKVLV